ncbi:MAG: ABC transporter permease [Planctomycetota bacterium]|nr:ABC transporter permease [Planctomycetota bacterium]
MSLPDPRHSRRAPLSPSRRGAATLFSLLLSPLGGIGGKLIGVLDHIGFMMFLLLKASGWVGKSLCRRRIRLGRQALATQFFRIGVRSVFIVSLVSGCVGLILAFQLAPPLDEFGQRDAVANIVAIAVLRELGPLIGSIVLTGFAGAAIAAEIGTMVVGEEIEALEAHALNPVRFLVVPRVGAAIASMTCLAVIADLVAILAALGISVAVLDIPAATYIDNTLRQAKAVDFLTGVGKATFFGLLIGLIACGNGLKLVGTSAGAEGVGRATTNTVVECIVAIILADLVFTAVFFALGLV